MEALAGKQPGAVALDAVKRMRRELLTLRRSIFSNLDAWQTVQVSRHPNRPQSRDYLELIFDRFLELHGDRAIGDDKAIVTGFGQPRAIRRSCLSASKKARTLPTAPPAISAAHTREGYRKALLKMRMAEKFGLPIICLIDTPGAYPGIAAEERGQALVIAENLREMSLIDTPILCVVIGEGGSAARWGSASATRWRCWNTPIIPSSARRLRDDLVEGR